jgi:hypothetical protein
MATEPLDNHDQSGSPTEEIEIAVEEFTGRPMPGNPAERIDALQKRIAYLEEQRRRSLNADEPLRTALLRRTDADLAEAHRQLRAAGGSSLQRAPPVLAP